MFNWSATAHHVQLDIRVEVGIALAFNVDVKVADEVELDLGLDLWLVILLVLELDAEPLRLSSRPRSGRASVQCARYQCKIQGWHRRLHVSL